MNHEQSASDAPSIKRSQTGRTEGKLTLDQRSIFLFQHLNPGSCVYNMTYAAQWSGPLDLELLQRAVQSLVDRHEALRTSITLHMGEPRACVHQHIELIPEYFDCAAQRDGNPDTARAWIVSRARAPFDLEQPGMLRVLAARIAEHDYVLCLNMHHVISDAWSVNILWQELLAAYGSLLLGQHVSSVRSEVTLLDVADRQEQRLSDARFEHCARYWQDQLSGQLPVLQLPYDREPTPMDQDRGARVPIALTPELSQGVRQLAAKQGGSVYVILLAAFAAFLYRYTRQADILIGTPVANRTQSQVRDLVGYLVNVLVIRSRIAAGVGFTALLAHVRRTIREALTHKDMPFSTLVEKINPPRDPAISPLFQALFVLQKALPDAQQLGPVRVGRPAQVDIGTSKFDLSVQLWNDDARIEGYFEYRTERFDATTISRMCANFERFLTAIIESPGAPLDRLPLLSSDELHLLAQWNDTQRSFNDASAIHELIEQQVDRTPHEVAVRCEADQLTYRELDARANCLAHGLIERGVGPDVPVGVSIPRSAELIISILAIWKAGGIYVPIDADYPEARRNFMMQDAGLALLLTRQRLSEIEADAAPSRMRPAKRATAESTAYMIYTSGSTGVPKGVRVAHRGVCNLAQAEVEFVAMSPGSRVLQFASFGFDVSIGEIVTTLCGGGTLIMAPSAALLPGPDLLEQLSRHRITHLSLPPSALAVLPAAELPDLRVVIVAGESCGSDLPARWGQGRRFINAYGPTEATVYATRAELPAHTRQIHIGKPLPNMQVWILDEHRQPVPVGVAGELYIGGVGVAQGYHKRDELTQERFSSDPFARSLTARLYRSGDMARYRGDGTIDFLGRIDHQVKVRGFRVELGEIEAALRSHPAVRDSLALVRKDYLDASSIIAYLVVDPTASVDTAVLHEHLRERLPRFMLPAAYVQMEAFPRLPSNKVDRSRLPLPHAPLSSQPQSEPPAGVVEEAIGAVWQRLLGVSHIGRHDSFFDLGGHSLLAAKSIAILAAEHDIEITARMLFERKTLAAVAAVAANITTRPHLPVDAVNQQSPLSHAQQRMWFLEQLEPGTATYNVCVVQEIHGEVELDPLARSVECLIARHPVFNIQLIDTGANVMQVQAKEAPQYCTEGLGKLTEEEWRQALRIHSERLARAPFALLGRPLYRVNIFTAQPGRCAIVLTLHHLLVDDASLQILERDLIALYRAQLLRRPPALPVSPATYLDFARWDRSPERAGRKQQLEYWRGVFSSLPPTLPLPFDFPRTSESEKLSAAGIHTFTLDASATQALMALARRCQTTPFAVMLAAVQVLLYRYTGEQDITVGVPVSVRPMPELEGMVGLFLNTLAIRCVIPAERPFMEFVREVNTTVSLALDHSDVPYEHVLRVADEKRQLHTTGLFQAMLVYKARQSVASEPGDLRVTSRHIPNGGAKFDLTFFVEEGPASLQGKIEYRASLFSPQTVQRLATHFQNLLCAVGSSARTPICELELMDTQERERILRRWNATDAAIPEGFAHEWFEAQAARVPEAIAVEVPGKCYSYAQLNRDANRLAHHLRSRGIGPGALAGIYLERCYDLIVAILAVLKSGAAYVPIDSSYPQRRVRFILEDAASAVLISKDALAAQLSLRPERVICLDRMGSTLAGLSDCNPQVALSASDLAYVIYTSGSTGQPKGVMIPHRGLCNYLAFALATYGSAGRAGSPLHSSISFDATITSLYVPLLSGQTLFIVPDDEIENLGALWNRERVLTFVKLTPAHLELVSQLLPASAAGNAPVMVVGGEALHASAVHFWKEHAPHVRVINEYGPTEATVGCCVFAVSAGDCNRAAAVPIGKPIINTRLYVLDQHLQPVPVGVQGELYIAGQGLAAGYLNRPELTAERFIVSPFVPEERLYRTGDLVKHGADGNLIYLGRRDHQVKIRGFRIELGEIEAVLSHHPDVKECAVAVRESNGRGNLVAYVVAGAREVNSQALRTYLGAHLPAHMVPAQIRVVARMPLTANGKLDRAALGQLESVAEERQLTAPRNEIERTLLAIWKQVLGSEQLGIEDNFFEFGGDSILSLQIVFQARQAGLRVKPRMLFDYQTVAALASVVDSEDFAPKPDTAAEQGTFELTPIQRWFFEHNAPHPDHFNQSYLFKIDARADLRALESAFARVIEHHDALRMKFRKCEGRWISEIAPAATNFEITRERLPQQWRATDHLEQAAARYQSTLNIESGPLLRAVYFHDRSGAFLLVVVHHLVIDGVSWRILLDDLAACYAAYAAGKTPQLARKTASFAQWSRHVHALVSSASIADERAFWQRYLDRPAFGLPRDFAGRDVNTTVGAAAKILVSLDAQHTRQLLAGATQAYYCNVADILLAALLATLRPWTSTGRVRLDLERHGRDGLDDGIDVSRTVGWFTAIHPLWLETGASDDFDRLIRSAKEAVRAIPNSGIGFGALRYCSEDSAGVGSWAGSSEICFNYLGRFTSTFANEPLLGAASLQIPNRYAAGNHRAHLLAIDAYVHEDRLIVEWIYNTSTHAEATIRALADAFIGNAAAAVEHCLMQATAQHTPADFPLVPLSDPELGELQSRYPELQDVYPLSFTQEGMLFHTLREPTSDLYFEQMCYRLPVDVDAAELRRAWEDVIERHAVLRTCIDARTARVPLQIVQEMVAPDWRDFDWRDLPEAGHDAALSQFLAEDRAAGFDLSAAPPYRFTLIRRGVAGSWFVISHHHCILDGWSVSLLLQEVERRYRRDTQPQLAARPFRDAVQWQRQHAPAAAHYWRKALAGLNEATPLPASRPVPAGRDEIQTVDLTLPRTLTAQLESFAREHRLTLSTVAQGAWAILLNRYTGVEDCLFGVTVSGRAHAMKGVESMVGLLISTLPCRVRTESDQTLVPWLQALQRQQIENEQHAEVNLADLKQVAQIDWRGELFQSILVFENYPVRVAQEEPLFEFMLASERTNYPLTLVLSARGGLHGRMAYDARYFDASTARALCRDFAGILRAMTLQPGAALGAIPMLSSSERETLLKSWSAPASGYFNGCLHELFERQVALTPEAPALEWEGHSITYASLNSMADDLAALLRHKLMAAGQRVGLFLPRSADLIVAMLGTLKAGGAYVPIDAATPAERVRFMLQDSEATVLITNSKLIEQLPAMTVDTWLIDKWVPESLNDRAEMSSPATVPSDLAYVIYTSGSTGQPKGVMVEHSGLMNYLEYARRSYRIGAGTKSLFHTSIGFDATITSVHLPLICGGCVVIVPDDTDVSGLARLLAAQSGRHLLKITPVHLELLGSLLPAEAFTKIAALVVGGEALKGPALRVWQHNAPDIRIFNEYGPTETVVGCCVFECGAQDCFEGAVPIGRPIDNTQLYILDHRMNPVPRGAIGELYIAGAGVARGYLNRKELTAAHFIENPFEPHAGRLYRTGDLVRALPDGILEYVGRRDQQIKLRGHRVELGEIEAQLASHPQVQQAAVALHSRGGQGFDAQHLAAYFVPDQAAIPSPVSLRAYLAARLPEYMLPNFFVQMSALPQTPNGKVDYKALPPPEIPASGGGMAPRNEIERCLCAIWQEVLDTSVLSIEDNFFNLGGHSLKAMRVIARIEQQLSVAISLRELFDRPSIRELSEAVASRVEAHRPRTVRPIRRLAR